MEEVICDQKVEEIDDCPRHARRAAEDGENKEPCEEENEDVGGPHTRVREPLRVPVQIRRRLRFHVQICHPDSDLRHTIFRFVDLPPFAFDFGFIKQNNKACCRDLDEGARARPWVPSFWILSPDLE